MPDDPEVPPAVLSPVEAIAQMFDVLAVIREAVIGYRAELLTAGVGDAAADMMAADVHRTLFAQLRQPPAGS